MGAEVYVDLYFLINLSMDFFCLLIAGRLLHREGSAWRLFFGAVIGGAYAVFSLLLGLTGALGLLCDVAAAVVIVAIAFAKKELGIARILHTSLLFALVSMLVGGVMTALYSLLNRLNLPFEVLQGDNLSVWLFGLLAIVGGIATARGGRLMGLSDKTRSVTVEAVVLGRRITLRAMVDSGNLLRDPISGRGVIVADAEKMRRVLPVAFPTNDRDAMDWLQKHPKEATRVRLIPARGAVGSGLLVAVLPDELFLTEGRSRYPASYLIALSSMGESARGFDAVIAPF